MRILSPKFKKAALKPQSKEVLLYLLEISHPDWEDTFYFVFNTKNIVSNGITYLVNNFQIQPPTDGPNSSQVTLVLDNVDRLMLPVLRSASAYPKVVFKHILASEPNTVLNIWKYDIRQIQYSADKIACTLLANSFLSETAPKDKMDPPRNRGLYKESE